MISANSLVLGIVDRGRQHWTKKKKITPVATWSSRGNLTFYHRSSKCRLCFVGSGHVIEWFKFWGVRGGGGGSGGGLGMFGCISSDLRTGRAASAECTSTLSVLCPATFYPFWVY